jgi:hypothetical protein
MKVKPLALQATVKTLISNTAYSYSKGKGSPQTSNKLTFLQSLVIVFKPPDRGGQLFWFAGLKTI